MPRPWPHPKGPEERPDDPPRPGSETWWYDARIERVVDGDTVDVWLDLGFRVWSHQRLRLEGIDAPEHYGPNAGAEGRAATAALADLVPEGTEVLVGSSKTGKYGRWIATVTTGDGVVINAWMVEQGHAVEEDYG